jgi:hypothetical protein
MDLNKCTKTLARFGCDLYTVETSPKRTMIRIQTAGDRRALLLQLAITLEGTYLAKSSHSSAGATVVDNFVIIAKPIKGATENLHIKASGLASHGTQETLDIFGYEDVPCYTFTDWTQIAQSISDELCTNPNVSESIWGSFDIYFQDFLYYPTGFNWSDDILPSEKNELGKYLGELLIGMLAFNDMVPIVKDPVKFIVPNSSCFSGIDCAIMQYDRKLVPISNKFGQGAKASFFTNLLPKIVSQKKRIKKSWALWKVLKAAEMADFDERRAKEIVYNYGVRALGLDIEEPYEVFKSIVNGKLAGRDVRSVVAAIRRGNPSDSVLSLLKPEHGYSSITGYFTRRLARDLNNCPASIEFLKELIAAKDFYQVNLNPSKWMKGEIEYKYVPSGNVSLTMMGDKATLSDLGAKQGLVNYLMKLDHEEHTSGTS